MGYYHKVYIVFGFGRDLEGYRTAGQHLPRGAIPLAVINCNTKKYMEIINAFEPLEVINFVRECICEDYIPEEMKTELLENFEGKFEIIYS